MSRPAHAHVRAMVLLAATLALVAIVPASGRAQSTQPQPPPPTPVLVPGGGTSPSPFVSALRTPPPSTVVPTVRAKAAVLADLDTGQVLLNLEGNEPRPIASLTKIMTALLVLEQTEPTDVVTVSEEAARPLVPGISGLGLIPGERIRVDELLYALMLQSANDAADALAEHVDGSVAAFVERMNARAAELGMTRSRFVSPSGLDAVGYSSARDLMRLTRAAFRVAGFASIVATRSHVVRSLDADPRTVQNRNVLLWLYPGAIGVKTGFTSQAGFCVVAVAEREGVRLAVVVLGEPGEPFSDAAKLLNYGFEAFDRRTLLSAGEGLGVVSVGGRQVPVAAEGGVDALIPVGADVERVLVLDDRVAFPPTRGEPIGTVRVMAGERLLGEVPMVVSGLPAPLPPTDDQPWWLRGFGALLRAGDAVLQALLE